MKDKLGTKYVNCKAVSDYEKMIDNYNKMYEKLEKIENAYVEVFTCMKRKAA